ARTCSRGSTTMSGIDPRLDPSAEADSRMLSEIGTQLVIRLSAMIRTARTHDVSNQAFQRQVQDLLEILVHGMEEEQEIALVAVADYLYLNGVRVKASASILSIYHALMGEFERRSLGGLRFLQGVHAPELERFFQLFMAADDPVVAERLTQAVEEASIDHVIAVPASELQSDELTRELE